MAIAVHPARLEVAITAEAAAMVVLAGLTLLIQSHVLASATLVSLDSSSQFFPWYAFLGQALRQGHVPGWNPANFAGTPFAANPLSGWTYLPAMVLFTLLPLAEAARVYLAVHPLLAGCSTYALARALGLDRSGALLAGVAYANTSYFQVQNACCFAFASVYAWLPVALLGAERALRSRDGWIRGAWWGVSGLAFSQILAAWLGQGAYYAAMLLGGYIAFRTLPVQPDGRPRSALVRVGRFVAHTAGVLVFGAAQAAAGLLPRMEFNGLSNLAGGYTGAEASVGGLHPKDWLLLATPGFWYVGASVLGLAVAATFVVRGQRFRSIWYFALTSIGALLVTGTFETPLHWLLYHLLPGFARLHPHAPERILDVAYLGPALLAGAALTAFSQCRVWSGVFEGPNVSRRLASGVSRRLASGVSRRLASGLIVVLTAADLGAGGARARADWTLTDPLNGADKLTPVDLRTYYAPDAAAAFLQHRPGESPFRYFGYAPDLNGEPWPYSTRFLDPATAALAVDNRALSLGMQDVQGYDASHLGRYDAYLAALNGRTQNYHDAEIFQNGLGSPLLDLLNVRYVLVPAQSTPGSTQSAALDRFSLAVYADRQVRVLENPFALPRAWIVHAATQAAPATALTAIASGQIDARVTAVLEVAPPPLEPTLNASLETARVTDESADRIALQVVTDSAGLLVLSEVYYPAWQAYVDGRQAALYVADGALRAVPISAGEHAVELRFESATLALGSAISMLAVGCLALLATVAVWRRCFRPLGG